MKITLFNNLDNSHKAEAIEKLISNSSPRQDFFLMMLLAVMMATFGLLINSSAVIIGSMLIAPMLYPILGVSLGIVVSDHKLTLRSLYTLFKSIILGIFAATLITILYASSTSFYYNQEIISRTEPAFIYAAIAFIAGLAASFAMIKPKLSETLPGIAISVALIPPLAVVGIGLASQDWNVVTKSLLLFLLNISGISLASLIVFSLMHLYTARKVAEKAISRDEKEIAKEIGGDWVTQKKEVVENVIEKVWNHDHKK